MEKITFLFGSGADTCYSKNMKSGKEFNEALLTNKYKEQRKAILGDDFINAQFLHPNSRKIYAQTIFQNQDKAREVFKNEREIVDSCISYYEGNCNCSESLKQFFNDSYNALNQKGTNKHKDFYLENANFFDTLDEKFNSLRMASVLNNNAKRVINAYWTIFLLLIEWMYDDCINNISNKNDVFEFINKNLSLLINDNNYYSILKNSGACCNIVTTNYTNFIETTVKKNVIYLHGKLTWFEDIEKLRIYDIENTEDLEKAKNSPLLLPFILIPSGVKPIICEKQLSEFSKFINVLKDSNELCIIGYRFNSEDNHVNSIIGEWLLKEGKHMTIFDYDGNFDKNNYKWLVDIDNKKIDVIDSTFVNDEDKNKDFLKKFKDYVEELNTEDK